MFYAITEDLDEPAGEGLAAHNFNTFAEANAFTLGVEFANDSALSVLGVYEAESDKAAIRASQTP